MSRILDELVSKRHDAVKNMQAMVEAAGGKAMDADAAVKFNNVTAEIKSLGEQIDAMREAEAIEDQAEKFAAANPSMDELTKFANFLRSGIPQGLKISNDVSTATGSAAVLVPKDLYNAIIAAEYDASVMLQLADVMNLGEQSMDIPVGASNSTAYWVEEAAAITGSTVSFSAVTLKAKKLGALVKASVELIQDSAFDIAAYIGQDTGLQMGLLAEDSFINGTASGVPRGAAVSASFGVTSSVTGSFNYNDIAGLFTGVRRPYRAKGSWLISDGALLSIMTLQDSSNQFIFKPSLTEGDPDRLLGKPMKASEYMPALTTGAKAILFGNFKYYKIGLRLGIYTQRLTERYAEYGQVGFLSTQRLDGGLTLPEAIKYLVCK